MLYTLNLYNAICQLYLNKTKKNSKEAWGLSLLALRSQTGGSSDLGPEATLVDHL